MFAGQTVESEVKAVAELGGDESRVVPVEAADSYGVVEQNAVIGDIDCVDGDFPALTEGVSGGGVEGGVDGKIRAVIRALIGAGETVGET